MTDLVHWDKRFEWYLVHVLIDLVHGYRQPRVHYIWTRDTTMISLLLEATIMRIYYF